MNFYKITYLNGKFIFPASIMHHFFSVLFILLISTNSFKTNAFEITEQMKAFLITMSTRITPFTQPTISAYMRRAEIKENPNLPNKGSVNIELPNILQSKNKRCFCLRQLNLASISYLTNRLYLEKGLLLAS